VSPIHVVLCVSDVPVVYCVYLFSAGRCSVVDVPVVYCVYLLSAGRCSVVDVPVVYCVYLLSAGRCSVVDVPVVYCVYLLSAGRCSVVDVPVVYCVYLLSAGRCSVVDYCGRVVCDIYAQPEEPITDYRTRWSGIRKRDMIRAVPVENARNIIESVIQVGTLLIFINTFSK